MKKLLLLFCICTIVSFSAFSQVVYLIDTAFFTDIGYGGAEASCKTSHMEYNSWSMNRVLDEWVADVFTVPAGATWKFDTVIVYGYQYGSTATSFPIPDCNLQIYEGTPGLGGSVIWGDTVTNLLVSSGWTGIYKVDTFVADNGLNSTERPIMYLKLYLAAPPVLTAGTYWLSWSCAGTSSVNPPNAPYKVLPGRINPPGQMGRYSYQGRWGYMTDSSLNIGMNMIIKTSAATVASLGVQEVNSNAAAILDQNIPNPFSGSTSISFYLPQAGYAKLCVYNAIGQLVYTPFDANASAGEHTVTMATNDLARGVYCYQLITATGIESKKMLLVK